MIVAINYFKVCIAMTLRMPKNMLAHFTGEKIKSQTQNKQIKWGVPGSEFNHTVHTSRSSHMWQRKVQCAVIYSVIHICRFHPASKREGCKLRLKWSGACLMRSHSMISLKSMLCVLYETEERVLLAGVLNLDKISFKAC